MGIEVEPYTLYESGHWPLELVLAVEMMQEEAGQGAVSPSRALALIKRHVLPLQPSLEQGGRFPRSFPRWSSFRVTGEFLERNAEDRLTLCIGSLLRLLPDWCATKRQRKKQGEPYCRVCWRHSVAGRKYCGEHDPTHEPSAYRKGLRLRDSFLAVLLDLREEERGSTVHQEFESSLADEGALEAWCKTWRPSVYDELQLIDDFSWQSADLLLILDLPSEEWGSHSLRNARLGLHLEINEQPIELFGMLRRCEAWLRARARARRSQGGKRNGAGRPRKPLPLQT